MSNEPKKVKHWITGCLENDRVSQKLLYQHYFAEMVRMIEKYTRDKDAVISIVNNGFLKIFKNLEAYDIERPFGPWAKTLVFRALSDYFRSSNPQSKVVSLFERDAIAEQPALDHLYMEDLILHLNQLPPTTKKVFILYAIEGYKHKEISEILSISDGTSKWHVSNARTILRKYIGGLNEGGVYVQ